MYSCHTLSTVVFTRLSFSPGLDCQYRRTSFVSYTFIFFTEFVTQWPFSGHWFTGEQITLGQQVEKVLSPGFIKRQSHSSVDGTAYSSGCA